MRISQNLANQIAYQLTKKSSAKVEKLRKDFEKAVTIEYIQQIPEKVIKCRDVCPDWFALSGIVTLDGNGFRWCNVNTTERVIKNHNNDTRLVLTAEIATRLKKLHLAWDSAKEDHEKLRKETENALLALGTYKQITEKFPDAAQYLPNVGAKSMALIPNLDGLKQKIKNQ